MVDNKYSKPVAGGPPPETTGWYVYDRIIGFDELGLMVPYSRMHIGRLEKAARHMRKAVDNDEDQDTVVEELAAVFTEYVQQHAGADSKAEFASALRSGNSGFNRAGAYVGAAASAKPLKSVRSFGDGEIR